jgi:hypothetical protein
MRIKVMTQEELESLAWNLVRGVNCEDILENLSPEDLGKLAGLLNEN